MLRREEANLTGKLTRNRFRACHISYHSWATEGRDLGAANTPDPELVSPLESGCDDCPLYDRCGRYPREDKTTIEKLAC